MRWGEMGWLRAAGTRAGDNHWLATRHVTQTSCGENALLAGWSCFAGFRALFSSRVLEDRESVVDAWLPGAWNGNHLHFRPIELVWLAVEQVSSGQSETQ